MRSLRSSSPLIVSLTMVLLLGGARLLHAGVRRPLSISQLSQFATLVVRGHVASLRSLWDPDVGAIYTYVDVEVSEAWKGPAPSRLTLKLLGGHVDEIELHIEGSPTLREGDEVALWLEVRPRDGTLYPVALDQGVHVLAAVPATTIALWREIAAASALTSDTFVAIPAEASRADAAFSFLPPSEGGPGRWHEGDTGQPVAVDFQVPPAGLGGGVNAIDAAIARWNGSGIALQVQRGQVRAPRCLQTFEGNGRISIAFGDPCGEISDSGSIVGLGGAYMTPIVRVVGGVPFMKIVQGMVVLNNSAGALSLLAQPGCVEDALTHNLGHALGLGHSDRPEAVMWPDPQSSCATAATALAADDIAGIRAIYPSGSTNAVPGVPTGLSATVTGDTVFLNWSAPAVGGLVQTYVVEAGSQSGLSNLANTTTGNAGTSVGFAGVPPGVYFVRLRARNTVGTSAPSNETQVNVACPVPGAPTDLTFVNTGLTVSLAWRAPVSGAPPTGYRLQVGSAPGLSNLLVSDQGPSPALVASGPPGTYFVRVISLSPCGVSAASNEVVIALP